MRVESGDGRTGFLYLGSLNYKKDNGKLSLEGVNFGDGFISQIGKYSNEVKYYLRDHLGSVRTVFNTVGAGYLEQQNDYSPFGSRLDRQYYSMSDGRYLYNGKEKQITGELNYLDYGARMYDDEIGRWFGLDPLAERHYDMSPYIFSGNNPMRYVDIDGRDWYEDVYKNVMWRQGSDDVEGYTNIGSSYTLDAGGGLSITYDQMDVTSMTFTGANASNWVSQISEGINCHEASSQILQNAGAETAGRGSEILVTALGSDGRAGDANSNAGNGFSEIDRTIEGGNPIIVGVDYKDGSPNADKMTDHFIVISSKTEALKNGKTTSTTYNYFDPRTSKKSYGISPNNVLMINNNYMKGSYIHGGRNDGYTVTTVRRNK